MKALYVSIFCFICACSLHAQNCPGKDATSIKRGDTRQLPTTPTANPVDPSPVPPGINERIIYWNHGLGGDKTSWVRAGAATQSQAIGQTVPGYPARKVVSLYPSYQQFSFSSAAADLHNQTINMGDPICAANQITDKTVNFLIGHSQGGLVGRATDKMIHDDGLEEQRRFGGMVTFGTSHQGAMILNNNASLLQMGEDACNNLAAGPIRERIVNNPILSFFVSNETFETLKNGFCNFAAEKILPIMYKDQSQPITEDYKVGAPALANLNGYDSELPKVAFYGVEEEPVFFRVMYSLSIKKPNEFLPFEANDDSELVNKYSQVLALYKSKYEEYKMHVEYWESLGFPCSLFEYATNPNCLSFEDDYYDAINLRNAWKQGYDWLLEANNQWKVVIGARTAQVVQTDNVTCNCTVYNTNGTPAYNFSFPASNTQACSQAASDLSAMCTWTSFPTYQTLITEKESDGVVLAESAGGFPGAPAYKLLNSNHQQMRNDKNTKASLIGLFDGFHGKYFTTQKR